MFLTRLLRGVPKYRTSAPKKHRRKYADNRLMKPEENLISCPECGSSHLPTTICLQCYMVIREQTSAIKKRMMMYNPYLGERQWHTWKRGMSERDEEQNTCDEREKEKGDKTAEK